MRARGMSEEDIVESLADKGFSYQDISEALNQADIKSGVATVSDTFSQSGQMNESALSKNALPPAGEEIPVPSPTHQAEPESKIPVIVEMPSITTVQLPSQSPSLSSEDIQEIIESIIEDRWQQVVTSVGDISLWKGRVDDDIVAIKQEILRVEDHLSKLQVSIIGRVDEYGKSISKVGSEVAALEKVFEKIMEPLTSNIKELNRITQELKKK